MEHPFSQIKTAETLGTLVPEFLAFAEIDLRFSRESIYKYGECLGKVLRICGNKSIMSFCRDDVAQVKRWLFERNLSVSRQTSILWSLKRFLRYLVEERQLPVLDPNTIRLPKRPR